MLIIKFYDQATCYKLQITYIYIWMQKYTPEYIILLTTDSSRFHKAVIPRSVPAASAVRTNLLAGL